ncbi:uncharacterized protein LOC128385565 isoform X1 [Panonychus citri]|uniref:uncharacterized protein LOC128385565 isoform X1 n=1 Tax=Panonychus citri TaxID=50023 RepID=UPI0023078CFE|nr:uncharacterized protein LOC128385565 isoform X1 [Panonychus citri]
MTNDELLALCIPCSVIIRRLDFKLFNGLNHNSNHQPTEHQNHQHKEQLGNGKIESVNNDEGVKSDNISDIIENIDPDAGVSVESVQINNETEVIENNITENVTSNDDTESVATEIIEDEFVANLTEFLVTENGISNSIEINNLNDVEEEKEKEVNEDNESVNTEIIDEDESIVTVSDDTEIVNCVEIQSVLVTERVIKKEVGSMKNPFALLNRTPKSSSSISDEMETSISEIDPKHLRTIKKEVGSIKNPFASFHHPTTPIDEITQLYFKAMSGLLLLSKEDEKVTTINNESSEPVEDAFINEIINLNEHFSEEDFVEKKFLLLLDSLSSLPVEDA